MSDSLSGPHLAAAFLCEKMMVERDGVCSFIRIVDRFNVPVFTNIPPGVQIPPPVLQIMLIVSLKAGGIGTGKYNIRIRGIKPDGSQLLENKTQAFFSGGEDTGVVAPLPLAIQQPEEGLYWFDIYFEEALLTRIPMRVLHQQAVLPNLPTQPPQSGG